LQRFPLQRLGKSADACSAKLPCSMIHRRKLLRFQSPRPAAEMLRIWLCFGDISSGYPHSCQRRVGNPGRDIKGSGCTTFIKPCFFFLRAAALVALVTHSYDTRPQVRWCSQDSFLGGSYGPIGAETFTSWCALLASDQLIVHQSLNNIGAGVSNWQPRIQAIFRLWCCSRLLLRFAAFLSFRAVGSFSGSI